MKESSLREVKEFWEANPCGAKDVASFAEGSPEFFKALESQRFQGDDFMPGLVGFDRWAGKMVLEVGCGLGTDLLRFARGGARVFGIDLTERGVRLARQRFSLNGYQGHLAVGNAEGLPFPSNSFDLVYAWGIFHHTPYPRKAVEEMLRVLRPGGQVIAMVYHRYSLVAFQAWLYYGFIRGKFWCSPSQLIAKHMESPGTRVFNQREARALFDSLRNLSVQSIVTRYDARIGRRIFFPRWVRQWIPPILGWFLVIRGQKENNLETGRRHVLSPFPPEPFLTDNG